MSYFFCLPNARGKKGKHCTVEKGRERDVQFQRVYYEQGIEKYPLGKQLLGKYCRLPQISIENHNHIPELRGHPNADFGKLKHI